MGNAFKSGIGAAIVAVIVAIGVGAYQIADTPTGTGAQPYAGVPTTYTHLVFDDEFNGTTLDTTKWTALNREGDTSNSEAECYSPRQVQEGGGVLTITAIHLSTALTCKSSTDATGNSYSYLSGFIQTRTFNYTYGTAEIRMQIPGGGAGDWPAFWQLGAGCQQTNPGTADNTGTCNWPNDGANDSGEIDNAEFLGSNSSMTCNSFTEAGSVGAGGCSTPGAATAYHTYDLVWSSGSEKFYFDGTLLKTNTTDVPAHAMFLILQYAVGGNSGTPTAANYPETVKADYIRLYQ